MLTNQLRAMLLS